MGAFGHTAFTVIWIASFVSYIGTAMFDTASGWLMTNLSADPLAVSLVWGRSPPPLHLYFSGSRETLPPRFAHASSRALRGLWF